MIRSEDSALRLLPRLTAYEEEPAWSPHGRSFAFRGVNDGAIYTAGTDGSHMRRATPPTGLGDAQPAWSLTGKIAFTRPAPSTGYPGVIYAMNPNGSALQRLADGRDPDWSPRGRYLAFTVETYINIVRSDGSGSRRLTRGEQPAWSPDGKWIVFARNHDLYTIRTAPACGGSPTATERDATREGTTELLYVEPSWQPVR